MAQQYYTLPTIFVNCTESIRLFDLWIQMNLDNGLEISESTFESGQNRDRVDVRFNDDCTVISIHVANRNGTLMSCVRWDRAMDQDEAWGYCNMPLVSQYNGDPELERYFEENILNKV